MSDRKATSEQDTRLDVLLRDAQEALRGEDLEGALHMFQTAARLDPDRLEAEGYVDLVRSRLLKRYRERLGDLQRVPGLRVDRNRITGFNLPADAGFMLSLVDGSTTLEQIVSLSGMAAFEAFGILNGLLDAGIIGVEA